MEKRCGTCVHFSKRGDHWETLDRGVRRYFGQCFAPVYFPSACFSVSEGDRREMREGDGKDCPCWKPREE